MRSGILPVVALLVSGCDWVSLAANALEYDTLRAGEAGNVAVHGSFAWVTLGDSGMALIRAEDAARIAKVSPPRGLGSVDDVAVAGDLLFALDARPPGALAVLSLRDAQRPEWRATRSVPVGPFSGISARDGICIVSGGTSALTLWRYESDGTLDSLSSLDLGRGQPDVLVVSASLAFVSSHYWGPYFGLDVITRGEHGFARGGRVMLRGAGFTAGGTKPANFPIESALLDAATLLVAHHGGLSVVDVAAPAAPRLMTTIDLAGPAVNVDTSGDTAAVSIGGREPALAFVTFPTASRRSARVRRVALPAGTKPAAVALSRRNALVAARGQGVLAVQR
jgi:hypothetical protein